MCGPRFCAMKITQDLKAQAADAGMTVEEAVLAGMEQKSAEFAASGGEVYVPLQPSRHV
jgi:phosphomethylpyrimidine synthase